MTADARPDAATNASGRKGGRLSRREDIARIALDLFARNGFEGTSIRDIAEAAGLTKPALYYHFQDKEALYEHVLVERMSGLIEGAHDAIASTDDPVERIRLFLDRHAARMDREREAWMVSRQSFLSLVDSARRERVTGLRDEYEGLLRDLIAAARPAGSTRKPTPRSSRGCFCRPSTTCRAG